MARRLLLLGGLAILAVIVFHGVGWGFTALLAWSHRYQPANPVGLADVQGTVGYTVLRVLEQAATFAVPVFLFISGTYVSFVTPRDRRGPAWRGIFERLRWLVIPYLVWSLVAWFGLWLQGTRFGLAQATAWLLTGSTTPAFYFIPLLVQLYLLSPLLVGWAKASGRTLLLAAGLVQLAVATTPYVILFGAESSPLRSALIHTPKWFFLPHSFWFVLGILFGLYLPRWRRVLVDARWVLAAAAGAFLVLGVLEWEWLLSRSGVGWFDNRATLIDTFYILTLLMSFVGFAEAGLRRVVFLEALGAQAFGIYLVHPTTMEVLARGIYHLAPTVLALPVAFAGLVMVVGLAVPLALMAVVRTTPLRPAYRYLFG